MHAIVIAGVLLQLIHLTASPILSSPFRFARQKPELRKLSDSIGDGPQLSINETTTRCWSFEEDVVRYRLAGINAMGVWLPKLMAFGEERGVEWLRENGMAVSTLSFGGGFTGAFGHELDDVMIESTELIQLAGRLRASSLVVVSGPINNHLTKHATRLVVNSLKELADEAAENNLTLSLLPMRKNYSQKWTFLNSLDEALTVLDRVNHPAVKLAFDVCHLWPERHLMARLPELVSRIGVVQVSDAAASGRGDYNRTLPGEGVLPVEPIISGLVEAGYRGYVDYQIWSESVWKTANQNWLARCRDNFAKCCTITR